MVEGRRNSGAVLTTFGERARAKVGRSGVVDAQC